MLRRERSPHADGVLCKAVAYCRPVAPEPAVSQAQRHARPLNRSESQARTRAALLDAAEALIVEHSIPALSLRLLLSLSCPETF